MLISFKCLETLLSFAPARDRNGNSLPPGDLPMIGFSARGCAAATLFLLTQSVETGAQGAIPPGKYECWYFSRAQPGLNFTVNGGGTYTDVEGKSGTISMSAGAKITFRGGAHDGSNAVYKGGNPPTISFIGQRGAEAAFCQLAR